MNRRFIVPFITIIFMIGTLAAAQAGENNKKHDRTDKGHAGSGMMMNMHFSDLDSDGNNALNLKEFKSRFPTSTEKSFTTLDEDGNGTLSHEEWRRFKEMHQGVEPYHTKEKFHKKNLPDPSGFNARFSDLDKNGNGKVNMPEFRSHFQNRKEHGKVFNAVDLDQNGYLTGDEWNQFRKSHGLHTTE